MADPEKNHSEIRELWSELAEIQTELTDMNENMEIYNAIFRTEAGRQAAEAVGKYYEVLAYVEDQRSAAAPNQEGYKLTPKEIAAVADCSRPHARNIIEKMEEWQPSTCEVEEDPLRLRVKWSQTTQRAAKQRKKLEAATP